mmetsp:Transcript_26791/g.56941  ORF Transcript_26791/g.56941 Transcript_26791/m.56941 type:complete len:369 (-) Transcript_26791:53-1159(-)
MHHGVDQHLLVLLADLRHVAEVDVRDAAVRQREDVSRVRVPVKEAKLQELPEARHDPRSDKGVDVQVPLDGGRVGAPNAVDPLHGDDLVARELRVHPGDLHKPVATKIVVKVLDVPRLLVVVQLFEHLLPEFVDDELGVAAEVAARVVVQEARQPAEEHQVALDGGQHPGPLHLDRHLLIRRPQRRAIHLSERRRRHGLARYLAVDVADPRAEVLLDDVEGLLVRERRHVVLQRAELLHVVGPNNVRPVRQDLPRLDERGPEVRERLPQLRGARAAHRLLRGLALELVQLEAGEELAETEGDVEAAHRQLQRVHGVAKPPPHELVRVVPVHDLAGPTVRVHALPLPQHRAHRRGALPLLLLAPSRPRR